MRATIRRGPKMDAEVDEPRPRPPSRSKGWTTEVRAGMLFVSCRLEAKLDLPGERYPVFGVVAPFGGVQACAPIFENAPDCGPLNMRLVAWLALT